MDKAAFELLDRLTQISLTALFIEQKKSPGGQRSLRIDVDIQDLQDLRDKARDEQKGGT